MDYGIPQGMTYDDTGGEAGLKLGLPQPKLKFIVGEATKKKVSMKLRADQKLSTLFMSIIKLPKSLCLTMQLKLNDMQVNQIQYKKL